MTLRGGKHGVFGQARVVAEIASPSAPDLTLVDLPGIVRNRMFC